MSSPFADQNAGEHTSRGAESPARIRAPAVPGVSEVAPHVPQQGAATTAAAAAAPITKKLSPIHSAIPTPDNDTVKYEADNRAPRPKVGAIPVPKAQAAHTLAPMKRHGAKQSRTVPTKPSAHQLPIDARCVKSRAANHSRGRIPRGVATPPQKHIGTIYMGEETTNDLPSLSPTSSLYDMKPITTTLSSSNGARTVAWESRSPASTSPAGLISGSSDPIQTGKYGSTRTKTIISAPPLPRELDTLPNLPSQDYTDDRSQPKHQKSGKFMKSHDSSKSLVSKASTHSLPVARRIGSHQTLPVNTSKSRSQKTEHGTALSAIDDSDGLNKGKEDTFNKHKSHSSFSKTQRQEEEYMHNLAQQAPQSRPATDAGGIRGLARRTRQRKPVVANASLGDEANEMEIQGSLERKESAMSNISAVDVYDENTSMSLVRSNTAVGTGYGVFETPWQKKELIGQGQFGCVYKAENLETGELMAVKQMKIQSTEMMDEMITEVELMCRASFRNEHVVQCFGWSICDEVLPQHPDILATSKSKHHLNTTSKTHRDRKSSSGTGSNSTGSPAGSFTGSFTGSISNFSGNSRKISGASHDGEITDIFQFAGLAERAKQTGRLFNVFMEFIANGSVASVIKRQGDAGLSELQVRNYTRQLLLGLRSLHAAGIAHRDIKCQNLLLAENNILKVADFGSAKRVSHDTTEAGSSMQGSVPWMSPEVIRQEVGKDVEISQLNGFIGHAHSSNNAHIKSGVNGQYKSSGSGSIAHSQSVGSSGNVINKKGNNVLGATRAVAGWKLADVWSVGCTIIEMATGKPPWNHYSNPAAMMFAIASCKQPPPFPELLHEDGHQFLSLCFKLKASERPPVSKLIYHEYLRTENVDEHGKYRRPKQIKRPSEMMFDD